MLLSLVGRHSGGHCVLGALSPVGFGSDVVVLASMLHCRKFNLSSVLSCERICPFSPTEFALILNLKR